MIDPKKRLEEILKEFRRKTFKMEKGITVYNKTHINQALTQILKEFVHQDSIKEIYEEHREDINDIQGTILSHLERIETLEKELKKTNFKIWVLKGSEQSALEQLMKKLDKNTLPNEMELLEQLKIKEYVFCHYCPHAGDNSYNCDEECLIDNAKRVAWILEIIRKLIEGKK